MSGELICVVDDDEAVRASLGALLETAGYRTALFNSGTAFLDAIKDDAGCCVLLDVKMPGLDGLEVQRRLNLRGKILPIIIVTGHGDIAMAVQAMRAGAIDFLEKPVSRERLMESVARAVNYNRNTQHDLQEMSGIADRIKTLSSRELQVLELLVMGRPNKTVAYALEISPRTVEVYRRNVMEKMDAKSLSHLVRMALVAGIDPLRPDADPAGRIGRSP